MAADALRLVRQAVASPRVRVVAHADFVVGEVDPRLFGGFVEHVGRAVYGGIYDPSHPSASSDGFRGDVLELVRELEMPLMRYPGGNFVSGYNWEDGVGPVEARPPRLELAWKAAEPNLVGTNEFVQWCARAGAAPYLAVNLGTRGAREAQALVEYCNHPSGTRESELRRRHGFDSPHRVKLWCLGNEADGGWQLGAKTAEEYGRVAREAAKMMKATDPTIELVVCGSSGAFMKSFGAWEYEVLTHTLPYVDYVSLHAYYHNEHHDTARYLGRVDDLQRQIRDVIATVDAVSARMKSSKRIHLALDEWNSWWGKPTPKRGAAEPSEEWTVGRPLLQEEYAMEDALFVGGVLITMLNHADRVRIGCLAQVVNAIAPIRTRDGGKAWRQTTFWPFALTSKYGRGTVLQLGVTDGAGCRYGCGEAPPHPSLVCAALLSPEGTELRVFALNRHLREALDLEVSFSGCVDPDGKGARLRRSESSAEGSAAGVEQAGGREAFEQCGVGRGGTCIPNHMRRVAHERGNGCIRAVKRVQLGLACLTSLPFPFATAGVICGHFDPQHH
ncbi:hypothetical protein AB1Y20_006991 [Prymnesium parvum]|uniref:non-reducing end alpha-L-arabinofuranosidase n=1 Tax=Prymnesium parvum TaxID=97485 RepID=A0AB34J2B7_PRYPA